jgi:hypothetical protein
MKHALIFCLLSGLLAGCGREDIQTYQIPKEPAEPPSETAPTVKPTNNHAGSIIEFKSDLPAGWQRKQGSGMRKAGYSIEGTSIDFYLISLAMGDLVSNVNRWRGQIDMAPASADAIQEATQTFLIDGHSTNYIEIYNEDDGKGIIAAIIDLAPQYWYFTAKGSAAELKANAEDIGSFLKSIRFESHSH